MMHFDPSHNVVTPDRSVSAVSGAHATVSPVSAWLVVAGAIVAIAMGLWMVFDTSGVMSPRASNAAPEPGPLLVVSEAESVLPAAATIDHEPAAEFTAPPRPATDDSFIAAEDRAPEEEEAGYDPAMLDAFAEGERLAAIGRHGRATRSLRRAIDLDPSYAPARYRLGLSYLMTGRRADAREQLDELRSLDPSLASLLENLLR